MFDKLKQKWLALPFFAKALTFIFPLFAAGLIWKQLYWVIVVAILGALAISAYGMLAGKKKE